jgi:iron-sulfur cluster insertion protein
MSNTTAQISPITVTDSAALKVYELMQEEGNLELKLRAFITGGGCSGFQYGFSFEEQKNEDDFEIVKNFRVATKEDAAGQTIDAAVKLLVDAQSFSYLKGAEIDYRKDINGEQFVIRNNPNAKTTCGCGSSFAVADENK